MKKLCDGCGKKPPRHTTHQATNRRAKDLEKGMWKTDLAPKNYPFNTKRLCRNCKQESR